MYQRVLMHILFGLIPFIVINSLITETASSDAIVMLNFLALILAIGSNFLAMPFINLVFRYQYKRFWNNYEFRNNLPRYNGNDNFHQNLYRFFGEMSSLDDLKSYKVGYSDWFNLQAVLIIPLIRMNSNMKIINNVHFDELKRSFNIFPSSLTMNTLSKKNFKAIKDQVDAKFNKEQVKETVKNIDLKNIVDHLNQDLMEK